MSISTVSHWKERTYKTVRQVPHRHGYHARVTRKMPFVSRKNRLLTLKFIKEHVSKGQEFWNKVIWSDETKINLVGSDSIHGIWRKAKEDMNVRNIIHTVKHGVDQLCYGVHDSE